MGTTCHFHVIFDVRVLDLNLSNVEEGATIICQNRPDKSQRVNVALQRLLASRKAYRAHLTTLYKIIEFQSATTIDELHIATLENYCQQLKRKKGILTPLDEQIAKAITKPENLESEIFETEEMHSTIDQRYSELTTFIEIKRNELKLKVTVQLSNNTIMSHPQKPHPHHNSLFNRKISINQKLVKAQLDPIPKQRKPQPPTTLFKIKDFLITML
jgi:hypothetical protein